MLQNCWSHQGNPWDKVGSSPAAPAQPAVLAGVSLTKAPPGFGWKDREEERCCSRASLVLPNGWSQLEPSESRAGHPVTPHLSSSCTEWGSRHSSTSSHISLVCSAPARAKQQGRASRGCQIHGDVPGPSWHPFAQVDVPARTGRNHTVPPSTAQDNPAPFAQLQEGFKQHQALGKRDSFCYCGRVHPVLTPAEPPWGSSSPSIRSCQEPSNHGGMGTVLWEKLSQKPAQPTLPLHLRHLQTHLPSQPPSVHLPRQNQPRFLCGS